MSYRFLVSSQYSLNMDSGMYCLTPSIIDKDTIGATGSKSLIYSLVNNLVHQWALRCCSVVQTSRSSNEAQSA